MLTFFGYGVLSRKATLTHYISTLHKSDEHVNIFERALIVEIIYAINCSGKTIADQGPGRIYGARDSYNRWFIRERCVSLGDSELLTGDGLN